MYCCSGTCVVSSRVVTQDSCIPIVLIALNIASCSMESNAFSKSMCPMQIGILNSLHIYQVDRLFEDDQLSSDLP